MKTGTKQAVVALLCILLAACADGSQRRLQSAGEFWSNNGYQPLFMDVSSNPADSLYDFANGSWMRSARLSEDTISVGTFSEVLDNVRYTETRLIADWVQRRPESLAPSQRNIVQIFRLYMDAPKLNREELAPLNMVLQEIGAISTLADFAFMSGRLARMGVNLPFVLVRANDQGRRGPYNLRLEQGGLTLPAKAYYGLEEDTSHTADLSNELQAYYEFLLGQKLMHRDALARSVQLIAFEGQLAAAHWDLPELRDQAQQRNIMPLGEVMERYPLTHLDQLLEGAGLSVDVLNIAQTDYAEKLVTLFANTDISVLRDYLTVRLITDYNRSLGDDIEQAATRLLIENVFGVVDNRSRGQRAVGLIRETQADVMGTFYANEKAEQLNLEAVRTLSRNVTEALLKQIESSDWVHETTEVKVHEKIKNILWQIGYASDIDWPDLSVWDSDSLFSLLSRQLQAAFDHRMARLGQSFDPDIWEHPFHRVNAIYRGDVNQITIPSGILQTPFMMPSSPAASYGALGAIIGHELAHALDDRGRHRNGYGEAEDYWLPEDEAFLEDVYKRLGDQYLAYVEAVELTQDRQVALGENLADLMGLGAAFRALQEADLPDQPGSYTNEQIFFISWAQTWRRIDRQEEQVRRTVADTHAFPRFRVDGIVRHIDGFYEAFNVRPGDALYLRPEDRIKIW